MSESDDDLKRRYRELAREEPSSALDAAILAKARAKAETRDGPSFSAVAGKEGPSLVSGRFRRWSVPLSLAAVLMLGVGVSLRMQLEKPGVETSIPNEYAMPEHAEPAPSPAPAPTPSAPAQAAPNTDFAATAPAARITPPAAKGIVQPSQAPKPAARSSAPSAPAEPAFVPTPPPASAQPPAPMPAPPSSALARDQGVLAPAPERLKERAENRVRADSFAPPPPPAAAELKANAPSAITTPAVTPPPPSAALGAAAPAAPAAAPQPQRAKREIESDAASGARALGKSSSRDPQAELERIAKLRDSAQHAEADKALEEFRKLYPGYRIPDAMWERVKPR